jgi:hypothetical protein
MAVNSSEVLGNGHRPDMSTLDHVKELIFEPIASLKRSAIHGWPAVLIANRFFV